MNHSPSKVLSTYLIAAGLFTDDRGEDWALFISGMQDKPSKAGCLYDTAGVKDGRLMTTGEAIFHYGNQLRVRGLNYQTTRAKLQAVVNDLREVQNEEVTIGTDTYTIVAVSRTSDILFLGAEDGSKRRKVFVCNFLSTITMEESS